MKYCIAYLMIATISFCNAQLTDYTSIPDSNFEKSLIYWGVDSDGLNGKVAKSSIAKLKKLILGNEVKNLTGIQDFDSLQILDCNNKGIEVMDLSQNLNLAELYCNYLKVPHIDLSQNKKLQKLEICCSGLDSLDLRNNEELVSLDCWGNRLKRLDLTKNLKLEMLECYNNLYIPSLDLSLNTKLKGVYCSGNNIPSLDMSAQKYLTHLSCAGNPLKTLNVSKNDSLVYLHCESDELGSIDLSNNILLEKIVISNNPFTNLDLSKNVNLEVLECTDNQLTQLDLRNNLKMYGLAIYDSPKLKNICVEKDQLIIERTLKDSTAKFSEHCDVVTKSEDIVFENQEGIYPNPTEGISTIKGISGQVVDIYNALGAHICTKNISDRGSIDMGDLENGLYLVRYDQKTFKLLKQSK